MLKVKTPEKHSDLDIIELALTDIRLQHEREVSHVAMYYWFVLNHGAVHKYHSLLYDPHANCPPLSTSSAKVRQDSAGQPYLDHYDSAGNNQYVADEVGDFWHFWPPARSHKRLGDAGRKTWTLPLEKSELNALRSNEGSPGEIGDHHFVRLKEDEDASIRMAKAQNPSTPAEELRMLSEDFDPRIRACIAANRVTPIAVLHSLTMDLCLEISLIARISMNRIEASGPGSPPEICENLWHKELAQTRKILVASRVKA